MTIITTRMNNNTLFRRITIVALLLVTFLADSSAVLKEENLDKTLSILRTELSTQYKEIATRTAMQKRRSEEIRNRIMEVWRKSNQNALMLYSQKQDYVFDLTYACHEATKQYHDFRQDVMPFRQWANTSDNEVARYDSLIQSLSTMPLVLLDQRALIDRNVCLTLAVNIRRMVKENQKTMQEYMSFYLATEQRLKTLYDYAQKRYADIQSNIFVNGDDDYITILGNLRHNISESRQTVADKYLSNKRLDSQWDASVIMVLFGVIVFYGLIAVTINQVVMRLVVNRLIRKNIVTEKVRETYLAKRACIVTVTTAVTFAVILFMTYISASISYKKREIGILRAVGARSSDVFGIFFNEALVISLIVFVLATIGSGVVVSVVNSSLRATYGLPITLLSYGIREIGIILLGCIATALFASFIPVLRIARKKPVDAIKNR